MLQQKAGLGLDPEQIKFVYLTHKNADHAGGARLLQETYGARILLSAVDWDEWFNPAGAGHCRPFCRRRIWSSRTARN